MSAERGNEGCGGMAGWQDQRAWVEQAGRDGSCLIKRPDPVLQGSFLISISYAMSPPLFPRLSGNLSPSLSGTLLPAKAPRETTEKSQPFVSHWEKLFSRQLPRKKWLSVGRMRMCGAIFPLPCVVVVFSLPHTISFALVTARLSPVPNPFFFCRPVTHSAGKSDFLFSQGSKLKAQPSLRTRSHILGLAADPRGPAFAAPAAEKKMLPFVREKRHLSLIPLPFPAGFHLNRDSCGHTLLVSSERGGPLCVHMCVRPVRDCSPKDRTCGG